MGGTQSLGRMTKQGWGTQARGAGKPELLGSAVMGIGSQAAARRSGPWERAGRNPGLMVVWETVAGVEPRVGDSQDR